MKFDEAKILRKQLTRFKAEIPKMTETMLTLAVNEFTENFRKQGFEDRTLKKWEPRKRQRQRDNGRAILVKSGALRRSLRKRRLTAFSGIIYSPLDYAKVHNEGLRSGRGSGFKIPKRQFVGDSYKLRQKVIVTLERNINKIFA